MGANLAPDIGYQPARPSGPLGVFATVGAAFRLYGADAVELWKVMAAVIVPVEVIACVLQLITSPNGVFAHNGTLYALPGASTSGFVLISAVGRLLVALGLLIASGAAYRILLGRHLQHPADLATSLSFALERFVPLLVVSILTAVAVLLGFIFIILPGIYLLMALWLAVPVLMAEDRRGLAALGRSRELVAGHWWHVLGCFIVAVICVVIGEVVISLVGKAVAPNTVGGLIIVEAVINTIVTILFSPVTAAVPVVLYVDMLLRKDDPQLERLLA